MIVSCGKVLLESVRNEDVVTTDVVISDVEIEDVVVLDMVTEEVVTEKEAGPSSPQCPWRLTVHHRWHPRHVKRNVDNGVVHSVLFQCGLYHVPTSKQFIVSMYIQYFIVSIVTRNKHSYHKQVSFCL